jgi:hypothetical protein
MSQAASKLLLLFLHAFSHLDDFVHGDFLLIASEVIVLSQKEHAVTFLQNKRACNSTQ